MIVSWSVIIDNVISCLRVSVIFIPTQRLADSFSEERINVDIFCQMKCIYIVNSPMIPWTMIHDHDHDKPINESFVRQMAKKCQNVWLMYSYVYCTRISFRVCVYFRFVFIFERTSVRFLWGEHAHMHTKAIRHFFRYGYCVIRNGEWSHRNLLTSTGEYVCERERGPHLRAHMYITLYLHYSCGLFLSVFSSFQLFFHQLFYVVYVNMKVHYI